MHIDFLLRVFEENKNGDAIIWNNKVYDYKRLIENIDTCKKLIVSKQIDEGAVVALEGEFSPNSIALILALIEQSCIIVPLNNTSTKNKKTLFKIAQVENVIRVNENDIITTETVSTRTDNEYYKVVRERKHPGLVLFTSGTSGEPKAAVHDLLVLLEKFKTKRLALRTLNFLLFDHWGGLNTMFYILSNNGVVITIKENKPEIVCELIEKFKIELLPASPTLLNLLLLSGMYDKYDLSSLKIISYGTEPMPENTLKRFNELFPNVRLLQTYGLTEVGVLRSKSKNSNSLWVKVGGEDYKTRVVDGMLEIKAKSAMLGYLNAPSPFTEDGWYKTGDAVEVDGNYIKILGKKTELINVGGKKVYPQEIENVILEVDNVAEVTVYGEKNAIMGNIVCAKVRLLENHDQSYHVKLIKTHCIEKLERFKVPVKINIAGEVKFSGRHFKKRRTLLEEAR